MKKIMRDPRKFQGGWVGWVALAGAAANYLSADNATDAQAQGAAASDATQRHFYDTNRADNADFMNNGRAANNALAYRLGVNPSEQGRQAAIPSMAAPDINAMREDARQQLIANLGDRQHLVPKMLASIEPELQARFASRQQEYDANSAQRATQQTENQTAEQVAQTDPMYGSLLRKFTQEDFNADPVNQLAFKHGLDQGVQGISRQASANGGRDSGAVLKALTRFGTDYGNTKAGESRNRFVADQDSVFNKLSGISGTGQTATQQVGSAGSTIAGRIGESQIGMGNARGASAIARGNALSGGLTGGYNAYRQNQLYGNAGYTDGMSAGGANEWERYL